MIDPTGYTALDLVGYTDRGTYSAVTNYVKNDLAHHNGIIWRCLIDDTIGITPVEGVNWTVFINAGSAAAEEIIAPIETSPAAAAHTSGTQLIYNDTLYDVIANISIGDSLTVGTNIQAAPKISSQIQTLTNFCIYKKRGIIFITDSFGTFDISGNTMMDLAAQYMGVTNYVAQAVNGAGFVAGTQTFKNILDSITAPSWTVTDIVVLGGTNDHNISATDITTAMATFVADAKALYPDAKIWFGCTGGPSYKTSEVNGPLQTINNIYPAWLNCMSVGAHPFDNLISALHGNVNKRSDNTHPDNNGLLLLAKSIAECLTTGRCHNNYLVVNDSNNTTAENGGTLYTKTIFQSLNDENVVIGSSGTISIGYTTPITITGNTDIHLLTFNKFIAAPNLAYHVPTEVNFVVSGTAHLQEADIFVDSNRLFLRTYLGTVANVERIQFTMPQITFPTMRC